MPLRIPSFQFLSRAPKRLRQRPSRLTLGVAAATAAAATGVAVATAVSGPGSASGTGIAAAINQAGAESSAAHPGHDSGGARKAPGQHPGQRPGNPAHAPARHAAVTPARPYLIYDSVTPSAIPGGHVIATYTTGPFAVSPAQVAGRQVLWIDTQASDPSAGALDVEPGDATPAQAATWTSQRLRANPHALARIYTFRAEWPATQAAIATLPHWMQSHVRWWIADPTGYAHVLPGSDATQWYWGSSYDISTATPRF